MVEKNRAALAQAILRRDDVLKRLNAMRGAADRASEAVWDAQARLDAARAATAEAKDAQIESFVTGETALAQRPVREARAAETDVEDDIAVAREAVAKLKTTIEEQERALGYAERRIENAIGGVMAGAVGGLLAEVEALEAALAAKRAVLFGFICPRLPPEAPEYAKLNMMALSESFVAPNRNHPALTPWKAAHEALLHDASAALPE